MNAIESALNKWSPRDLFFKNIFLDLTPFCNLKLHFPPLLCQIIREICENGHFWRILWLIWYTKGEKCSFRLQKGVKSKNIFSKIKTRGDYLFNALSIAFIRQLEPKIDTLKKYGAGLLYFPPKKTLKCWRWYFSQRIDVFSFYDHFHISKSGGERLIWILGKMVVFT